MGEACVAAMYITRFLRASITGIFAGNNPKPREHVTVGKQSMLRIQEESMGRKRHGSPHPYCAVVSLGQFHD
jgi:hypothetical protein